VRLEYGTKWRIFHEFMFTLFASDRIKFLWREKLKNWFLGQNNIYTSLGERNYDFPR
jgi:hypothetical protein